MFAVTIGRAAVNSQATAAHKLLRGSEERAQGVLSTFISSPGYAFLFLTPLPPGFPNLAVTYTKSLYVTKFAQECDPLPIDVLSFFTLYGLDGLTGG